jgi:hypothetical protein
MRNLIKYLSLGVGVLILAVCLGTSAQAVVFPSQSVINPVTEVVYVPDNFSASGPGIKVYSKASSGKKYWQEEKTNYIKLPSECYGLAVWQSTSYGKLLISINDGTNSKVRYYKLDSQGFPGATYKDVSISEIGSSPVGIVIASTDSGSLSGDRAYVADAGNGRVYYLNYNTATHEWIKGGYFETDYNIYGIAVTPSKNTYGYFIDPLSGNITQILQSSNYKIFASTKVSPGKVQIFDYSWTNGSTIESFVASGEVTGLQYPTFMKADSKGEKLYVAVNGSSGGDVKAYDINDSTPVLSNAQTISSPITGAFGWTDIEISFTGKTLFFSQKDSVGANPNTNIYKVDLPVSATTKVSAVTTLTDTEIDGLVSSTSYPVLAGTHSLDGSLIEIDGTAGNNFPDIPKNLKQYKKNGSTELKAGDTTDEDQIVVKFDVSDQDGDKLTPVVRFHMRDSDGSFPSIWTEVTAEAVASGNTVTMTLPKSGSFSDGEYEWQATVIDEKGFKPKPHPVTSYWADYNDDGGFTDFNVLVVSVDTTSPEAITDLSAIPGTNKGDVDITWTAPGDDGNKGTASGYTVRYITSTTALTTSFTESNFDTTGTLYTQSWTPLSGGSTEKKTLTGIPYSSGTPTYIYIAMRAYDEVPNTSLISNVAATFVKDGVPKPAITLVYPSKAPENTTQTVAVEGSGFWGTPTVELIKGSTTIKGSSVSVDGTTKITCTVNLTGAAIGKYDVKVTNQDLQSATSAQAFEVIASGSDTTAPALITDFTALAGDQEVSLSWTNPSDTDLAEIIVLRKLSSYPSSSSDSSATKVYPTTTTVPKPGDSVTTTDKGLTNGTTYYYAVFSRDTSSNWNNTVTAGSNADNATPSKDANPPMVLTYDATRGNIFWVSVPYVTPTYNKASDIIADINAQNGKSSNSGELITSIGRWDGDAEPQIYESWDYLGVIGWSGIDFNIEKGEAIYINIASTAKFTLKGSHDKNFKFNLAYSTTNSNLFWVSLPYKGDYTDAKSIIADINASAGLSATSGDLVGSVGRWNSSTQQYERYDYLGILGWSGTNFKYEPVEGYVIDIKKDLNNWTPKVK